MRLEIKGKKNRRKKNFSYLLSDLLILIFPVVILYAHWVSENEIKRGVKVAKMQKKPDFSIFKFVERPLNISCQTKFFAKSIILAKGTKFSGETKN